jgi:hypothetical protein
LTDAGAGAAFTNANFFIVDSGSGMNKAIYAAALTAWANSSRVFVYVDPATFACYTVEAVN